MWYDKFTLGKSYNFDINNKYKYYNPNLIRNNGQIKKDQVLHCDSKTSLIACPNDSKNNNQNNVESAIVPSKKKDAGIKTIKFKYKSIKNIHLK